MNRVVRVVIAVVVAGVGFSIALLFGPTFGACLGLSTTAISCVQSTGIYPEIGYGQAILALTATLSLLLLFPIDRRRRGRAVVAFVVGLVLGGGLYAALGPRTMAGWAQADIRSIAPESPAPVWTVIDRPLDVTALVFVACVVAGIAVIVVGHWPGRSSGVARAVAAASLIVLPPIAFGLLLIGGDQINGCLGLSGCPGLPPPPPVLMSSANVVLVVAATGMVWMAVLLGGSWELWRRDRGRLMRILGTALVLTAITVALVGGVALVQGDRLRQVAFNGVVGGLIVAAVAVTVGMARAIATPASRAPGSSSVQTTPSEAP